MKGTFEVTSPVDPETLKLVEKGFVIEEIKDEEGLLIVQPRFGHDKSFDIVLEEFGGMEQYPLYRREGEGFSLRIVGKKGKKKRLSPLIHGILFLATIFTVTIAGYIWWAGGDITNSFLFTIGLMGILGSHELGHALVARKNKVDATLPFFLPVPPFFAFGTLGAVIFMNSPIPNRRSLFDIGIAGPITGFVLSIPVLIIGISLSSYVSFDPVYVNSSFLLGTPILFNILTNIILGSSGTDQMLLAHPIAIAGWAGLFVTTLNLLPMGQLDGGHVIRSLFPNRYKRIYKLVFKFLFMLGALGFISGAEGFKWLSGVSWPGWLVWAALVYFMTRLEHPGPLNDVSPLDKNRKLVSIGMLIIFLLSFTPAPIVAI